MEGVKRGSRSDEEQLDVLMEERFLSASSSAGITGRTNSKLEFFCSHLNWESVEGALPKEAGANFTWDSVHVNLRSVFGDGGWVRRRGDLRGGTAEESGREREKLETE